MDYTENTDNTPLNYKGEPIPEGNIVIPVEAATALRELLEDTVEYWCRENSLAGETAWKVASSVALAKEAQFRGLVS